MLFLLDHDFIFNIIQTVSLKYFPFVGQEPSKRDIWSRLML